MGIGFSQRVRWMNWIGGDGSVNAPPVNISKPTISGTPKVGETLSVTTGTWTGVPAPSISYQWTRDGSDISGATDSTYTLIEDDEGAMIGCRVTATNAEGSDSADAEEVGPVDPGEPGAFHPIELGPVAFYNRNDLSSMLQAFSSSGMNRVTAADQPVGVAMDVAQPKGSEMVSNGTFDSDIAGWESTAGWAGGDAIWTADGIQVTTDNWQGKLQQITCEVGKTYLLRFRVVSVGGGASSGRVYVSGLAPTVPNSGAVLNLQNLAVGQHAAIFTATMATHSIGLSTMQSAGVIVYDDISLVEIPGYHMTQATSGARPTIKLAGSGNYYLDFDGSDDELAGTFPDLGSNCTVARSIPGVGAEILTGQSINGAFSDSTDSHVLLIFDGPLGAGDTAKLSAWLDGVADGSVDPAPPEESEPMVFLMESGDEMLLEDGGPILLEDE